jgi:hypothetical protein
MSATESDGEDVTTVVLYNDEMLATAGVARSALTRAGFFG